MSSHLLQALPSVIRERSGAFEFESDFGDSLRLYADGFDRIAIACPLQDETAASGEQRYRALRDFSFRDQIRVVPLPHAYGVVAFLRNLGVIRQLLGQEVDNADFLLFSPHGMIGDGPTVAVRSCIPRGNASNVDLGASIGSTAIEASQLMQGTG